MPDPSFALRAGQAGPRLTGTPGHVLTVDAGGDTVSAQPAAVPVVPFPVGDIDASGVPDGQVIVALGGLAVWAAVPTAFAISSFAHGPTLVEVGATVTNPAFTASYNQAAAAASLTDTEGHNDVLALPATAFVSPHAFTKNVFAQSVTFTLHASNPEGTATAAITVVWGENVYFAPAVDPGGGGYNAAFITSLAARLGTSANGTYAFNAGAGQSSFFCALTSLGLTTANFFVGGFPFACSRVATGVNVVNGNGIAETYDVFRSDNVALGAFNLTVQ